MSSPTGGVRGGIIKRLEEGREGFQGVVEARR